MAIRPDFSGTIAIAPYYKFSTTISIS